MRSDRPEAGAFQDFVVKEVLPSIRKNGGYVAGQEKLKVGEMTNAHQVRVVEIDGNPWFVALDVAECLGFTSHNMKSHTKNNLSPEERVVVKLPGLVVRSFPNPACTN